MQESILRQIANTASKSKTNNLFIIGKGPSLDSLDFSQPLPGIVVCLNDAERVVSGDFGVFSANWVRHSLLEEGFRCGFYLAGKPLPQNVQHVVLPPIPIELDQEDLTILRLQKETFFDEPFVLLNALKIACQTAQYLQAKLDVYLLGFDFTTALGSLAQKAGRDFSGTQGSEREALIAAQESQFLQFLRFFESNKQLRLLHVGTKSYSAVSPASFHRKVFGKAVATPPRSLNLSDPERVLVVAEFTNNHLGDPARLVEMAERAKDAGADLIKVQKRDVDAFYTQEQLGSYYWSPFGKTLRDYRQGVELNQELLELLDKTCRKLDIRWFCSVLDWPSFQAVQKFRPALLKIPSTISNHRAFHAKLGHAYQGPLVVSTGFTEEEYLDHILRTFPDNKVLYLLHCVSAYPTPKESCHLAVVRTYRNLVTRFPKLIPGYSSHDLGSMGCMLAVAAGARMIEKHVKLGNVDWVHFDKVAIDLQTEDFARFVRDVRLAEEMTGSDRKTTLPCEHHKYPVRSTEA